MFRNLCSASDGKWEYIYDVCHTYDQVSSLVNGHFHLMVLVSLNVYFLAT